ncbi:MAG: hypothetical protein AB7S48_00055 [Bacteroidales bacterium]
MSFHIVSRNYIEIGPDYENETEHEVGRTAEDKELLFASDIKKHQQDKLPKLFTLQILKTIKGTPAGVPFISLY